MKKLGKLAQKKPTVIFIYGPIAVGKLTVAKILSKKLGYKLSHNHALNDFVDELFARSTFPSSRMKERLRYELMESAVKAKINFITTHAYSQNYVSDTGLSDPKYLENLEKKMKKCGANFYPIHLKASDKELLRRVSMNSRKNFKKLRNKKIMQQWIKNSDFKTSPKLKNNFVIDNTNLSPKKVSEMIIKKFKLK